MDVPSVMCTAMAKTGRGGALSKALDHGDGGEGPSRDF